MVKTAVLRGLLGFPLGIALGYLITIILSLAFGHGSYSPAVPGLIEETGSEINAVLLQAVLCGILGSGFAAASLIYEVETWSLVKQTALYFLVASVVMLPIAFFAHWMERSVLGFALYFGIFVAIFVVVWIIQFFYWKLKIAKLNQKLEH